jgi:outer membrane protein OmpA-like peptidoglycan-associated protein
MKTNKKFWLWLAVAIIVGGTGCDLSLQPAENAQSKKGTAPKPQQTKTVQKPQPAKPVVQQKPQTQQQPQQQPQQQRRTITDDVNSVVNYGIGATQLKAKQNMQNKIQNIQQRKNKEMEDALK